jgi:hypothetical protein
LAHLLQNSYSEEIMKRDKKGLIIDNVWTKFKSWKLGRQLRKGKVPRGRVVSSEEAHDAFKMGCPENALEAFGMLSLKVIRADGHTEDLGLVSVKKITTAFRDYIVDSLQNSTTSPLDAFKYHASGTTNTAESNTDTALVAEVESRVSGTQIEGATADIYKSVATVQYTATRAIVEHGIFSASTSGTLMDRSVFTTINVDNGDSIQFTYEATFNAEA